MTVIVEDGSGVQGANSYSTAAAVLAYLTDRNRQTENAWDTVGAPAQEAAVIAATDFIENRFKLRFKGTICFPLLNTARTVMTFTVLPVDAETVTLDTDVFTFKDTPVATNDVQIGATITESIDNLILKVAEISTTIATGTFFGDAMLIAAAIPGTGGNNLVTSSTVTGATFSFATTRGGDDRDAPQPLSFPRANLFSRDGAIIVGIPDRLIQATAEYAVRALTGVLQNDVVPDASGRVTTATKVKVGPIETETKFQESTTVQIAIYPAADALLAEYLNPTGGVFR